MALDLDFQLLIDNTLSVAGQVSEYVDFALETELAAQLIDEEILNRIVNVKTYIDGALDTIDRVRSLSDVITFEFMITEDILNFIDQQLNLHSPVKTGKYKASHVLFADGILVPDVSKAPTAHEFMFINTTPYSLKVEAGESPMAPNGVYELSAHEAQKKFPTAHIEFFDYVGVFGVMAQTSKATYGRHTTLQMNKAQNRYPAIRVTI